MPSRSNTRAAQGSGTIRQRKDGRWEARYTLGYNPSGKQIRRSIYGATEKEVRRKLTAVTSDIDNGIYIEPSKLTVSQWLDIWTAEYLGEVKPRTVESYTAACRLYLKPELGRVKLSALSTHTIQTAINKYYRDKGLSPKTVKNAHGVLHKAMQQAVEIGYLRFNPANSIRLPRIEKKEIQPLDDDKIAAFLEAIQGHKWEAVFLTTIFTGMRQGEVLGLTWPCIDFQRGTILIDRQLQRNHTDNKGKYEFISPKNDKSRRISPAPSVVAALKKERRRQAEMQLQAGSLWEDSNLVFTNEFGRNLSVQSVYKEYKKLVAEIGIPTARFHDLRHTYAVSALQSGDDVKTVQETLGHHTAAFTLDVYGHVTDRMKQESAARMEAYIQRVKKGSKNL
ncbi:MAG: site-specific integrase [Oscillospiraceae bacterium]|jgi:integrase|nr:site-specific integrase [Oscillospiraceae bacterium]